MAFSCAHPARLPVKARQIFLPCREQWVVSLWAPRLSPNSSPGGTQPLGAPGSQRWAAAQHGAALWTSAPGVPPNARPSVCFVPFPSPAWACRHSAPDLILVESKRLLSTTGGRMQRRSAGSALLPERGILIILMRGQLAGVRSSPRVCVLVIYRQ